ncbi:hypothetical protein EV190_1345 [Actinorugispora endophytica]|uniref:YbaB/EbfC DNA-binding family protein n=2 Tax=Actinorugispora endophytica TaxID=1605990 RepID=A0A4R6UFD8_9ACTN|nr:hypothetical protein EV190_1345 [Actinorugispora endophytica]
MAKDRLVSAKVNAKGELIELKFHTQKYRQMAPKELSTAITDVIERARKQMAKRVVESYGSFAPEGVDLDEIISGRFNPSRMLSGFDIPFPTGTDKP